MNSVSVLIYLTGMMVNLKFMLIMLICACVMLAFGSMIRHESVTRYSMICLSFAVGIGFVAVLVPNEKTMLLIATSEVVGMAANTPTGQAAINLLNQEITSRLQSEARPR